MKARKRLMIPDPIEFDPALSKQKDSLGIGANVTRCPQRLISKTV
jgi:hypothetical protein